MEGEAREGDSNRKEGERERETIIITAIIITSIIIIITATTHPTLKASPHVLEKAEAGEFTGAQLDHVAWFRCHDLGASRELQRIGHTARLTIILLSGIDKRRGRTVGRKEGRRATQKQKTKGKKRESAAVQNSLQDTGGDVSVRVCVAWSCHIGDSPDSFIPFSFSVTHLVFLDNAVDTLGC